VYNTLHVTYSFQSSLFYYPCFNTRNFRLQSYWTPHSAPPSVNLQTDPRIWESVTLIWHHSPVFGKAWPIFGTCASILGKIKFRANLRVFYRPMRSRILHASWKSRDKNRILDSFDWRIRSKMCTFRHKFCVKNLSRLQTGSYSHGIWSFWSFSSLIFGLQRGYCCRRKARESNICMACIVRRRGHFYSTIVRAKEISSWCKQRLYVSSKRSIKDKSQENVI